MSAKHTTIVLKKEESRGPQIIRTRPRAKQEKGGQGGAIARINALLGEAEQQIRKLNTILAQFSKDPSLSHQAHLSFQRIRTELPEILIRAEALCLASRDLCLHALESEQRVRQLRKTDLLRDNKEQ